MLDIIELTPEQSALLAGWADRAGGTLILDYRGTFTPAGQVCIGLRVPSPGVLLKFGAMVVIDHRLPDSLHAQLVSRICEDGPHVPGGSRVYYWPGVICPELAQAKAGTAEQELPGMWSRADTEGGWTEKR